MDNPRRVEKLICFHSRAQEKVVTQNVELKETIVEKDETINQIGRMYMKLKALTDWHYLALIKLWKLSGN